MASPPSHSQSVLPGPEFLILKEIVRTDRGFILYVQSRSAAVCPKCGHLSRSRHSTYTRKLQDLPWQGQAVEIHLSTCRYRCRHRDCPRKIFTQRIPQVAWSYARQTVRLADIIRAVGYAVGGLPAQRLLERLAICVSDDTILRQIKAVPSEAPTAALRNLGVDDWAWRKGQNYGTILVDLDRHRVVDLLADRSVDTFRAWLEQRSGIAVIARDRSGIYAEASSLGAPEAQQVADRFHLILNFSAALERAFQERGRQLLLPPTTEAMPQQESTLPVCVSAPTKQQLAKLQNRERRLARYRQVIELHRQGHGIKAISRRMQMERKTVRHWIRSGQFPEHKTPQRPRPKIYEFADHLRRRWAEGCHNVTQLFQEIREIGYKGGRSTVARFVSGWRNSTTSVQARGPQRIAPKHAAILITRKPEQLSPSQQLLLARLSAECPDSIRLRRMSIDFREALTSGDSRCLRNWIERVKRSEIGPMVRFAWSLTKDLSAVNAAVDTEWSSGQVEGQINRLKILKRQMYGRAGFALLRARTLPFVPFVSPSRSP